MKPLLAQIDEAAFNALPDETVLGKDSFVKNEKENKFFLNMSGDEAGKLAIPLQTEVAKLTKNNKDLLDEKVKKIQELEPFQKLGKTAEEIESILKEGKTPDVKKLEEEYTAKIKGIETERDRLLEAAKTETETERVKSKTYLDQLHVEMKNTTVAQLMSKHDMNALGNDWLANRIQVVPEEDGSDKFVVRVFENGQVAYKGATFKTADELVQEAKANKDLGGMFNGGTGGGSGADARQKSGGVNNGLIKAGDDDAMSASIEDLATGKVKVVE